MHQRRHELGAGTAERMAERDRAAVDVEPRRIGAGGLEPGRRQDRKSTRLNSSHLGISYAATVLHTLSLHDALPISSRSPCRRLRTWSEAHNACCSALAHAPTSS